MKTPIQQLEEIVCTVGEDRGVVLLDHEGRTHWSDDLKCHVYENENFSPLGDALIQLHDSLKVHDELLGKMERALSIPAAEYVPGIAACLSLIHQLRTGEWVSVPTK